MIDILRLLSRTASAPTMMKAVMAINAIQSSNPIDAATRSHNRIFAVYVAVLILTAVLTWLVWRSGNKVQEAVRADADARIKEAGTAALEAHVKAGKIETEPRTI
jgi:hypothetical protein